MPGHFKIIQPFNNLADFRAKEFLKQSKADTADIHQSAQAARPKNKKCQLLLDGFAVTVEPFPIEFIEKRFAEVGRPSMQCLKQFIKSKDVNTTEPTDFAQSVGF